MAGKFSDYQVEKWLEDFSSCWLALHFEDPDTSGAYASEIFGGAYVRKQAVFGYPSSRAVWNSGSVTWSGLPAVVLTHVGAWDSEDAGNLLMSAPLPDALRIVAGGSFTLASSMMAISFQ